LPSACLLGKGLTPRLTGAGARSAQGTKTGQQNAEGMARFGVRVEPPVRLGSVGTVLQFHFELVLVERRVSSNFQRFNQQHLCLSDENIDVIDITLRKLCVDGARLIVRIEISCVNN
jgi:hypothetical protein